jgi:lipoate-protein ligase B
VASDNTGVFLNEKAKIGSIGVQVRHRLTSHGFAFNVTREPLAWFEQVVACGLTDVKAECMENAIGEPITVNEVIPPLVETFGRLYGKDMEEMDPEHEGEIEELIKELEQEVASMGEWTKEPPVNAT